MGPQIRVSPQEERFIQKWIALGSRKDAFVEVFPDRCIGIPEKQIVSKAYKMSKRSIIEERYDALQEREVFDREWTKDSVIEEAGFALMMARRKESPEMVLKCLDFISKLKGYYNSENSSVHDRFQILINSLVPAELDVIEEEDKDDVIQCVTEV